MIDQNFFQLKTYYSSADITLLQTAGLSAIYSIYISLFVIISESFRYIRQFVIVL